MAVVTRETEIRVADEAWVALALLHQEHPERPSFRAGEIRRRVEAEGITGNIRAGMATHISQHNVANVEPSSCTYRMFYRLPDGTYRLYREGDDCHPRRRGKVAPLRAELPEPYRYLLDWYEGESRRLAREPQADPVLAMLGAGKEIWEKEHGDAFIARLRSDW